jgi:hypothetical protein
MARVFISYSHQDQGFVSKLVSDLKGFHDVVIDLVSVVPDTPLIEQSSERAALARRKKIDSRGAGGQGWNKYPISRLD